MVEPTVATTVANVYWQALLGAGAGAGALTAVWVLLNKILGSSKRAVRNALKSILEDKDDAYFKPIGDAIRAFPDVVSSIKEMAGEINKITETMNKMETDHCKIARETLRNSLTRIYYDIMESDKEINMNLYKNFMSSYDIYESMGGNGVLKEFKTDLQNRRAEEIKRSANKKAKE